MARVAFRLPANLAESVRRDPSDARGEWAARLPDAVRELSERWSLRVGEPYEPGGQAAWVAPARTAAGQERVLKVGWRHYESEHEAAGLRAWGGRGAVLLHDAHAGGSISALLLERCRPGTALGDTRPEIEQDAVIAGLMRRLWGAPHEASSFRPLQSMCDAWAAEFELALAADPGALDPGLAWAGMELLRALPHSAERAVLLATDLHAGNVLASAREPWLAIDPKPYVGDPAYEPLQHMLNCDARLAADPRGLAGRMADLLELDRERVALWLFARCVQESIEQPSLRGVAAALAPA